MTINAPSGYKQIFNSKAQIVIKTWKAIDKAVDASKRRVMGAAISDEGVRYADMELIMHADVHMGEPIDQEIDHNVDERPVQHHLALGQSDFRNIDKSS